VIEINLIDNGLRADIELIAMEQDEDENYIWDISTWFTDLPKLRRLNVATSRK
jgi:hypothetical protein